MKYVVHWPMGNDEDEQEMCNWLEALINLDKTAPVFDYSVEKKSLFFYDEADAIAFKLRFKL